jgi:hypothetical protein
MRQSVRKEGASEEVRQVVVPACDCLHFRVPFSVRATVWR